MGLVYLLRPFLDQALPHIYTVWVKHPQIIEKE